MHFRPAWNLSQKRKMKIMIINKYVFEYPLGVSNDSEG